MATTILKPQPLQFRVVLPAVRVLPELPIRERIVRAVKQRLQTILQANDYETDIGQAVVEGMLFEAEPDPLPVINFWDGAETAEAEMGMIHRALQLTIETYDKLTDDPTAEGLTAIARHHLVDVERALWRDPATLLPDPTFGGLAVGMTLSQSQPHMGYKPIPWAGSISLYEIMYRTKAGNPYSNTDSDED